jgi:lipoate-protein ligase A
MGFMDMNTWRLLDMPPMTAAENMALDEALLELKGKGETPNTIRFLQFSPRAVLVGYHQSVEEEVRVSFCLDNNIHINRRITGGGAIFFDENQLGWEIICDKGFFNVNIPNAWLFKTLCTPVVMALDILGLNASFRPRNDIEINGRKISGTGGTESEKGFMFQGTMLVDFDVDTMLRSLKIPVEKLKAKEIDSVKERVTCLTWELGRTPPAKAIKEAIKIGFERSLGIRLEPSGLTNREKRVFRERAAYYQTAEWIDFVRPQAKRQEVIQAASKVESGLVRYTLVVDQARNTVKDIYITGDFLSFPSRALYDMESRLRGKPLDRHLLNEIINRFFRDGLIHIPGMCAEDFTRPLDLCLEKIAISDYGIPLENCNQISVTNGSFEDILRIGPSVLLLPYCSKDPECDLRYKKGCRACGNCSIGPAWKMGREHGMKVRCVVSFEDLIFELDRMKRDGDPAFIGCCCQPFFTKHVTDFEKAGVPGILLDIDSTTCYELDQAKEAYAGEFTSQTSVNLDLLNRVLITASARKSRLKESDGHQGM